MTRPLTFLFVKYLLLFPPFVCGNWTPSATGGLQALGLGAYPRTCLLEPILKTQAAETRASKISYALDNEPQSSTHQKTQ